MKSSVLKHPAERTSQGAHSSSKIRESPVLKTKNTSASKFSPARDHMQFPSYKKRPPPKRMVIKIAHIRGISQALAGAPRPYTAIVLRRHVISSCLRRIKTAPKYQNIAIARGRLQQPGHRNPDSGGKKGEDHRILWSQLPGFY